MRIYLLILISLLNFNSFSQNINQDTTTTFLLKKPPSVTIKIILTEYLGGMAGGYILAAAGAGIGLLVAPPKEEWSIIGPEEMYIGAATGYVIGSAIGVNFVGNHKNLNGKFIYALSGNIISGLLGGGLIYFSSGTGFEKIAPFVSIFILPPVGAIIGYNMSRQYNPNASTGLKVGFGANSIALKFSF